MKNMYKNFIDYLALILLFSFFIVLISIIVLNKSNFISGSVKEEEKIFVIGVSQSQLIEPWQIKINEEIKTEASKYKNIQVIYLDAVGNANKQIKDLNKLNKYKIDLLIISPINTEEITKEVSKIYKDIPVIVLDREIEGYDYSLYIGPDNITLGKQVGDYVLDSLKEDNSFNKNTSLNIVEIKGDLYSKATLDRSQGFKSRISQNNNIKIIKEININWNKDKTEDKMINIFSEIKDIDIIFAHNDAMALGAFNAYKKINYNKNVKFIGIDGLSGENDGLNLVENGIFDATFTCPTGGKEAIQYAVDILNRKKGIPKKVILRSRLITKKNIYDYKEEVKKSYIKFNSEIKMGFCNVGNEGAWREANEASIKNAANEFGINLIYAEAELDYKKQIEILNSFIDMRVDIISFSPVKEEGYDEILRRAKEYNIPVILADRNIQIEDKTLYNTFLGSDFKEEGRRAARWCIDELGEKKVNVFEIQGIYDSTPTNERKKGFEEIISQNINIKKIDSDNGNYTFEGGKSVTEKFLKEKYSYYNGNEIVIFSHNDDMALGAIEAIENFGLKPGKDIKIVSIDGIKKGILALQKGKINCIVECNPLIGPEIMKLSEDILNGKNKTSMIITNEEIFKEEDFKREWLNRSY